MIEVRNAEKRWKAAGGEVSILRGVSLSIAPGETVALLGPSGAGKTTLLNLIAGVDAPTSGEILVNGQSLRTMSRTELAVFRRETVGMIFQNFHLLPGLTALENAALPLLLRGESRKAAHHRAREVLGWVGLDHRAGHLPEQLSGGERQRVAIARALAAAPPILLADEPTGSLDSANGAQILNLLEELHRRLGHTLLIVTHDPQVARWCDRVVYLEDGQVRESPPEAAWLPGVRAPDFPG